MTFIANPLGSLGHSPQSLGNLTAGVEALQRTEMQRKLDELRQNRAWERDDRLRNEKETLEALSVERANAISQNEINKWVGKKKEYDKFVIDLNAKTKGNLSFDDRLLREQKKQELTDMTMQSRALRDSYTKYQENVARTLSQLKDPVQKAKFEEQQAVFSRKLADPTYEPNTYDMILAQQVPEPSSNVVFAETTKNLLPFVDSSVKAAGNGRTEVDRDKLMQAIKSNVAPNDYLYTKGEEEGRWKSPDEMYTQIAERLAPSIKTDVVGWKPNEPTEKEKFEGVIGRAKAVDVSGKTPNYMSDRAYISTNWGTPISITTKEGIGEFTPKQSFPNGMVQGTVKVAREVVGKERDYNDVEEDQANQAGSRIEVTQTDEKGNPTKAKLITKSVIERTEEVPWNEYGDVLGKRDPNMKKYFDSEGVGINEQKKTDIPMKRASGNTVTLTVNGKTYNIPKDKVAKFKKDFPDAK